MKYITKLIDFYKSKEWEDTRQITWNDRLNEDGEMICEDCGLPIIKQKDGILHHKIELTLQNVNDLSISLNPDNLVWLHHRCHNVRHARFCSFQRKVYLVVGSPLSGKSTFVENAASSEDVILDFDKIWESISNNQKHIKNNRLKPIAFSLRECLMEQIKMRSGKWINAWVISSSPRIMDRQRLINSIGVDEVIYMDATENECIKRLHENPDGRNIEEYEKYIKDYFEQFQDDSLI